MSKGKILKKNHFRYNTHPSVLKRDGKGHVSWSSAKKGHKEKVNVITHSDTFFGVQTKELLVNPEKSGHNTKKSRASIPKWINDKYLENPKGTWRMSHRDSRRLRRANKIYEKTGKWKA